MKFLDFLTQDWTKIVIPLAVFVFCLIALLWLRKQALYHLSNWSTEVKWPVYSIVNQSIERPFLILCIILSAYLGLATSPISNGWKSVVGHSLWTLFVFVVVLAVLNVVNHLTLNLGKRLSLAGSMSIIQTVNSVIVIAVSVLVVLAIWGIPTAPILLLVGVVSALVLISLRDTAPNFFSSLQLKVEMYLKAGDLIKLETGEEGIINKIGWINTQLRTTEGDNLIIPNSQFTKQRVTKVGYYKKKGRNLLYSILTARELEIARLISHGATNKEIAKKLVITENTAKVHVKKILKKLDLKSRQELAFPSEQVYADTKSTN